MDTILQYVTYLVSEQGQSVEDDPEQDVDGGEGLSQQPPAGKEWQDLRSYFRLWFFAMQPGFELF